ncbi:MAG: archease [Terriglobia bacterium]
MSDLSGGFALLDHPADLGIEAYGHNLAEAFEQAALGLVSIILDSSKVDSLESRSIILEGVDIPHLLVKWLTEILYLYDGQGFASGGFEISQLTPTRLEGIVHGEPYRENKHTPRLDVKAITYHQLWVEEGSTGSRLRVFLDI